MVIASLVLLLERVSRNFPTVVYKKNIASMKKRLMVSIIFLIPLMYVSMGHMFFNMTLKI